MARALLTTFGSGLRLIYEYNYETIKTQFLCQTTEYNYFKFCQKGSFNETTNNQ